MHLFRHFVLAIAAGSGVLLSAPAACAHELFADVKPHADGLRILAYTDDDMPADHALVFVIDSEGKTILTGRTDDRGVWVFPRPTPGTYTLQVKWVGHLFEREFRVEDESDTPPVVNDEKQFSKAAGLSIGLVSLLAVSAASWLMRRRHRFGRRLQDEGL